MNVCGVWGSRVQEGRGKLYVCSYQGGGRGPLECVCVCVRVCVRACSRVRDFTVSSPALTRLDGDRSAGSSLII